VVAPVRREEGILYTMGMIASHGARHLAPWTREIACSGARSQAASPRVLFTRAAEEGAVSG